MIPSIITARAVAGMTMADQRLDGDGVGLYDDGFPDPWVWNQGRRASTRRTRHRQSQDICFMPRKKFGRNRKNRCRFCTPEGCPRPAYVDYKDIGLLKKLCTNQSKMFSRKRSGNCAAFQRASSDAVKRARFMALIPYVGE